MFYINSVIFIFLWIFIVFLIALICRKRFPEKKEFIRKIIHIGSGPLIPLVYWLQLPKYLILPISITITFALIINYRFKLIPGIEDIKRKSFGTIAYGLSISLLLLFLWPSNGIAIVVAVLVMAFGDGLAGLIGKEIRSKTWQIFGQTKSLIGTSTMLVVSAIILIVINILTEYSLGFDKIILLTLTATGLEQISVWGIDNFTVPISTALLWIYLN